MEISMPALKLLFRTVSSSRGGLSAFGLNRNVIGELTSVGLVIVRPRASVRGNDTLFATEEGIDELRLRKAIPFYQCMDGEVNGDGVFNGKHGVTSGRPCCAKARLLPMPRLFE